MGLTCDSGLPLAGLGMRDENKRHVVREDYEFPPLFFSEDPASKTAERSR
jgi:hypothetical protein